MVPPANADGQNMISAPASFSLRQFSGQLASKQICIPMIPKSVVNTGGSTGPGEMPF